MYLFKKSYVGALFLRKEGWAVQIDLWLFCFLLCLCFIMCFSQERNLQQTHATFNVQLQLQIPTLGSHNLRGLEHLGVAQICFTKPWCLEGFLSAHIYDYKANKTHTQKSLTEIFTNGSLSAQKCLPFSEGFMVMSVLSSVYPSISHGL